MAETLQQLDALVEAEMAAIAAAIDERLAPLLLLQERMEADARPVPRRRPKGEGAALVAEAIRERGHRISARDVDGVLTGAGYSPGSARNIRMRMVKSGTLSWDETGFALAGTPVLSPASPATAPEGGGVGAPAVTRHPGATDPETGLHPTDALVLIALRDGPLTGAELDKRLRARGTPSGDSAQARLRLREAGRILPDLSTGKWRRA